MWMLAAIGLYALATVFFSSMNASLGGGYRYPRRISIAPGLPQGVNLATGTTFIVYSPRYLRFQSVVSSNPMAVVPLGPNVFHVNDLPVPMDSTLTATFIDGSTGRTDVHAYKGA